MPFRVVAPRSRVAVRLAALCVFSAGVAACSSDVARFDAGGPQRTAQRYPSPPETTGTIKQHNYPRYQNQAPVERQQLPDAPAPQQSYNTQPSHSAPPQTRGATASVKHAAAPRQLAAMRKSEPAAVPPARSSGVHVVGRQESLKSIGQQYGRTSTEIAKANSLKPSDQVRVGQRLIIPGVPQSQIKVAAAEKPPQTTKQAVAPKPATQPATKAAAVPAAKAAPAQPVAKQAAATPPAAPTKPVAQAPAKPVQVASATRGAPPANLKEPERVERAHVASPTQTVEKEGPSATGATSASFRWPVRGRVVAGFGPKSNGEKNEGINLAVPEGTSVKAAEDGVVAYSGNELKGYGNLVLVRHSNGYVTAYAHANELKVKRGETVKRGQIIATAGQTGNVPSPQLHFEVRKGSTPVDPMPYLNGN